MEHVEEYGWKLKFRRVGIYGTCWTVCVIKGSVEIFVNENLSSISCRNIKIWQKKNRIIEKKIRKGIMSGNFMWKFIRYIHNSKYFGH